MAPRNYAAVARQYARDVVAGRISTCKWARQACQRQLDDLEHFTAFHAEGGAQGWMTFDQSGQGLAQSFELEVAAEPPEGWQVIGGEIRFELMEEPEAGLGVGGRICMAAFTPMARAGVGGLDFTAASLRKHFEIRLG